MTAPDLLAEARRLLPAVDDPMSPAERRRRALVHAAYLTEAIIGPGLARHTRWEYRPDGNGYGDVRGTIAGYPARIDDGDSGEYDYIAITIPCPICGKDLEVPVTESLADLADAERNMQLFGRISDLDEHQHALDELATPDPRSPSRGQKGLF